MLIYRLFIALFGAVIGTGVALAMCLTIGGGIHVAPTWGLIIPLAIGAVLGSFLGFHYHKATLAVVEFVSKFFT